MPGEKELCSIYDPNRDTSEHLAAEVRRLFRAILARDERAIALVHGHFLDYIGGHLTKLIRERPLWKRRWIDDVDGVVEVSPPNWFLISGEASWMTDHDVEQPDCGTEPFEFEIELCPTTGEFRQCEYRFGMAKNKATNRVDNAFMRMWAVVSHFGVDGVWKVCERVTLAIPRIRDDGSDYDDAYASRRAFLTSMTENMAALTRVFRRDVAADDNKAAVVSYAYLRHYLLLLVSAMCRDDPMWKVRTFGLLGAPPETRSYDSISIRDVLVCQRHRSSLKETQPSVTSCLLEPVELFIELSPKAGSLTHFKLQFGYSDQAVGQSPGRNEPLWAFRYERSPSVEPRTDPQK